MLVVDCRHVSIKMLYDGLSSGASNAMDADAWRKNDDSSKKSPYQCKFAHTHMLRILEQRNSRSGEEIL